MISHCMCIPKNEIYTLNALSNYAILMRPRKAENILCAYVRYVRATADCTVMLMKCTFCISPAGIKMLYIIINYY